MDAAKKKVLLIEDDEAMLDALYDTFSGVGFNVYKTRDGKEGLSSAFSERPDVVILDLLMPKMDGTVLMERLREDDWGKEVPVIVLTNVNPEKNDILDGVITYKPAYYLVKSDVSLETIVTKVKELLGLQD